MPDTPFDAITLVAIFGSIVTTIGGFFVMWNIMRTAKRDTKDDMEKTNKELEGRMKEHINNKLEVIDGKLENMDNKIDDLNEDVKKKDENYHREFNGLRDWLRNVESNVMGHSYRKSPREDNFKQ